jgi:hypothetical protein
MLEIIACEDGTEVGCSQSEAHGKAGTCLHNSGKTLYRAA